MALICVDEDGFRGVNEREKDALKFTFGRTVGNCLIDIIRVEYDPDLARTENCGKVKNKVKKKDNKTYISMKSDYGPPPMRSGPNYSGLIWLGCFIHEAAHIWQRNTGLRQEGEGGTNYEYDDEELPELKFEVEQHASAVQDWFIVKYGVKSGLADLTNPNIYRYIWTPIFKVFEYDIKHLSGFSPDQLQQIIGVWDPVIEEIRDPDKFPGCPRGFQLKLGLMAVGA